MELRIFDAYRAQEELADAASAMEQQLKEVKQKTHNYLREDEEDIAKKGRSVQGVAFGDLVKTRQEGGVHPDFELTKVGQKLCSLYKAELDILEKWKTWANVEATGLRFVQCLEGSSFVGGVSFIVFTRDRVDAFCESIRIEGSKKLAGTSSKALLNEVEGLIISKDSPRLGFAFMVGIGKVPMYLGNEEFYTGPKKVENFAQVVVAKVQVYLDQLALIESLDALFISTPLRIMHPTLEGRNFKNMDTATHGAQSDVYSSTGSWSELNCPWSPSARRLLYSSMLRELGLREITNGSFVYPLSK